MFRMQVEFDFTNQVREVLKDDGGILYYVAYSMMMFFMLAGYICLTCLYCEVFIKKENNSISCFIFIVWRLIRFVLAIYLFDYAGVPLHKRDPWNTHLERVVRGTMILDLIFVLFVLDAVELSYFYYRNKSRNGVKRLFDTDTSTNVGTKSIKSNDIESTSIQEDSSSGKELI